MPGRRHPDEPAGDASGDAARALIEDALAFAAAETSLLDDLGALLDELRAAEAADTAGRFDTDAIWQRVSAQVWGTG